MEVVFGLILIISALVALDVAALRWGKKVRDTRGEWSILNSQDESWVGNSNI